MPSAECGGGGNLGELLATVKQCPQCGVGVTHYRGHACHHIGTGRGCVGCVGAGFPHPQHWCYVCLGPWPCINAASNGCNTFCDATCDCPDCPDCKVGCPCANWWVRARDTRAAWLHLLLAAMSFLGGGGRAAFHLYMV